MRSGSGGALNFLRGATGPLIGLILLGAFLSLTTDTFLTLRNFLNVMDQVTVLGVMAVGMTLVILIGGIDLSVGSVLALSGMVMGFVGNHLGLPFGIAITAALIASSLCGVVSGLMVTRFVTVDPKQHGVLSMAGSFSAISARRCPTSA